MPIPANIEGMSVDQLQALAVTIDALGKNKDARKLLQKSLKTAFPDAPLPEYDNEALLEARDAELRKQMQEQADEIKRLKMERDLGDARSRAKAKYKLSDAEIADVEKLMTEHTLTDYDLAADYFVRSNRPAPPAPTAKISLSVAELPGGEWAKALGNRQVQRKVLRQTLYDARNEFHAQQAQQ